MAKAPPFAKGKSKGNPFASKGAGKSKAKAPFPPPAAESAVPPSPMGPGFAKGGKVKGR